MWEYTILKISNEYKVTRRNPEFSIAETKVFQTKQDVLKQIREWLN